MQSNIDPADRGLAVTAAEAQERIKRRSRIRIQQRFAQARLADHTFREIYRFLPRITKTQFPVPCFKVITKFSHLAFKAEVKQHIVFDGGRCSVTYFQGTIFNSGGHPNSGKVCARWQSCVGNGERIKGVLYWHTDARRTKGVTVWLLKWIRGERS